MFHRGWCSRKMLSLDEKRARQRENARRWRQRHPERAKAQGKKYRASVKGRATTASYYKRNIEKLRKKSRLWQQKWRKENPEEARAAEKKWRDTHPEQARAIRKAVLRAWRNKNPEKARAAARRQRAAKPEERRAWEKRWRKDNPHKVVAKFARRKGRLLEAVGSHSSEQIAARVAVYDSLCAYCGAPYESIDHVIPLARRGSNWPANLRPACRKCNSSKGDKLLSEWSGPIKAR
jgi:5-methylcytosine-specific restriction endonuclease McrA